MSLSDAHVTRRMGGVPTRDVMACSGNRITGSHRDSLMHNSNDHSKPESQSPRRLTCAEAA